MTEHEAIIEIKDRMQIFEPVDNEELESQIYGNMTIDEIVDALKDFNGLVGEIKQILRGIRNGNDN